MCDLCGYGDNEERWTTPPATAERFAEVAAWMNENILDSGHQVITVPGHFAYSAGRSLFGYSELLITGALPPETGTWMINTVAGLEARGEISLAALVGTGPVQLDAFACELRFERADPMTAPMRLALGIDPSLAAVQIVWPDPDGRWPENAAFAYGMGAEPLHTLYQEST